MVLELMLIALICGLFSFVGAYSAIRYFHNTTMEVEYPLEPTLDSKMQYHKPIKRSKRRLRVEEIQQELVQAHNNWLYHQPPRME